jgi:RND superfamily putative drug exporter
VFWEVRRVQMFDRLAKGIVKHHKKVVIVWLVLLVLSIYPIQFVRDVIVYEEAGFAPPDVESQRAQDIIDEQFPRSLANSSVIVVVEASDIASEDVKDFAIEVEQSVVGSPEIQYLYNFTSVYSVYQFAFVEAAKALEGQLHATEMGIDQTGFLFYSSPSVFAPMWDDSPVDDATYSASWTAYYDYVNDTYPGFDLPPLMQSYSMLFRTAWDNSFDNSTNMSYTERANEVLEYTTPTFFNFNPDFPSGTETQLLYYTTFHGLDISTWNNSMVIHFVMLQAMQGYSGATLTFLENLYQLGPTPTRQDIDQLALTEVESATIGSYWLQLPSGTQEFLVNTTTNTMLFSIDFSITPGFSDDDGNNIMERNVKLIREAIDDAKNALGVQYIKTYTTGDVALGADIERAAFEDVEKIDPITVALVFIIIGVFFLSFITPGVAVGGIGIAVVISQSIIIIIGMFVAKVHFSVLTLMLTAMLGAGTDYAIFLMARYREERLRGNSKEKSVEECVRWAGESITTSGLAVMISFGALGLGSFALVKTMGLTIMLGIGIALLVALTFIPSLLMLVGDRVFWPGYKKWEERRKKGNGAYTRYFRKSAQISVRHAKKITVMALVLTIPAIYGVFTIETSFDFLAAMPETEATLGIEAMGAGFGEGRLSPTLVIIEAPSPIRSSSNGNVSYDISYMGSVEALSSELSGMESVQQVNGPTRPQGVPIDYTDLNNATLQEQYAQYIEPTIGEDNQTILLSVILKKEAFTPESVESVGTMRSIVDDQQDSDVNLGNSKILVGGATAAIKDIKDVLDRDFQLMAVVVIIADFILLMFVLGSILVPLRLILTILLSISWTLAATFLVFQVWLQIPILWLMPWILFVIAMGLGMDYDIFLTTRIREEVAKGKSDKDAIVTAVEKTGGIITAAGLVMAGAFATMMLSSLGLLQEFGFALAFVILLDAMIVRIYLVPSVMILLEKWNWWAPGRLQRVRREEKKARRRNRRK